MKSLFGVAAVVAVVLGGAAFGIGFGELVARFRDRQVPVKYTYLVKLRSDTVSAEGTRIENNGFCTSIYQGDRVDAVICEPHIIIQKPEPSGQVAMR